MSFRYGVLALLAEQPRHGYDLKTAFERQTGGEWAINVGQVYTTLQRLERDGLVEPVGGDGDRNDYRITPAGRSLLDEWYATPVTSAGPPRDELMIKVLLAVAATDVDVTDILQRQRRASVEQLQAYTRRKARAHPTDDLAFLLMLDASRPRAGWQLRTVAGGLPDLHGAALHGRIGVLTGGGVAVKSRS